MRQPLVEMYKNKLVSQLTLKLQEQSKIVKQELKYFEDQNFFRVDILFPLK